MASVLLTWELGGGWGHLMRLKPIARGLVERGHRVFVALRDLSRAVEVFGPDVKFFQAPIRTRPSLSDFPLPMTLAHILGNNGFGVADELWAMCDGWQGVFDCAKPDLMICDHSPTALLAARGRSFKRCIIGTGFTCPPDQHPLPNLRSWMTVDSSQLLRDEQQIQENMNNVLHRLKADSVDRVTRLYSDVDGTFLMTLRELDHYPNRDKGAEYWGEPVQSSGAAPEWPRGRGPKIFAYLKPFVALGDLLSHLNSSGYPTLIYTDRIAVNIKQEFSSATLCFASERVDLKRAAQECDLAILHGTHGSTLSLLLSGKPTLQLPIFLEQVLMGQAVARMGAGLVAPIERRQAMLEQLQRIIGQSSFANAARTFAAKYVNWQPPGKMLDQLERLLTN